MGRKHYARLMCVDLKDMEEKKDGLAVRSLAKDYVGLAIMGRDFDERNMVEKMFCPLCGHPGMIWERTKISCPNQACDASDKKLSLGEWGMLMALKEIKISNLQTSRPELAGWA